MGSTQSSESKTSCTEHTAVRRNSNLSVRSITSDASTQVYSSMDSMRTMAPKEPQDEDDLQGSEQKRRSAGSGFLGRRVSKMPEGSSCLQSRRSNRASSGPGRSSSQHAVIVAVEARLVARLEQWSQRLNQRISTWQAGGTQPAILPPPPPFISPPLPQLGPVPPLRSSQRSSSQPAAASSLPPTSQRSSTGSTSPPSSQRSSTAHQQPATHASQRAPGDAAHLTAGTAHLTTCYPSCRSSIASSQTGEYAVSSASTAHSPSSSMLVAAFDAHAMQQAGVGTDISNITESSRHQSKDVGAEIF